MIEYGTTGAIGDGKLRLKCMALLLGRLNVSTSFFFFVSTWKFLCPSG